MADFDEYDLFLRPWEPSERLIHASLSQNINDPYSRKRLLDDSTGTAPVKRAQFAGSQKVMADDELAARTPATKDAGISSIFAAPISVIQHRVVEFAPFIEGMDLAQLEFVATAGRGDVASR
jgi:hypothetical protein